MIDEAISTYLQMSSEAYATLLRQMLEKQRNVLLAIASFYQIRDNRTEWFQGLEPNRGLARAKSGLRSSQNPFRLEPSRGVALGKNAMLFFFLYSTYLLAVIAIFPINIGGCRLGSTAYGGTSTHGHLISKVCYPESRCIECSSTF